MKKITGKNYKKVLKNIETQISEGDNDERQCWFETLNEMLDELLSNDFFGTEGQNDPRGDHRDDK